MFLITLFCWNFVLLRNCFEIDIAGPYNRLYLHPTTKSLLQSTLNFSPYVYKDRVPYFYG